MGGQGYVLCLHPVLVWSAKIRTIDIHLKCFQKEFSGVDAARDAKFSEALPGQAWQDTTYRGGTGTNQYCEARWSHFPTILYE
jgi:hypothetical protein